MGRIKRPLIHARKKLKSHFNVLLVYFHIGREKVLYFGHAYNASFFRNEENIVPIIETTLHYLFQLTRQYLPCHAQLIVKKLPYNGRVTIYRLDSYWGVKSTPHLV